MGMVTQLCCKILRAANHRYPARAICKGASPMPIPEGEPIPNKSPGDSWLVRLGEFDAELDGKPGTMVTLYLRVEAATYLDPNTQDGRHYGWPEDSKPWCIELVFATRHQKDGGKAALDYCGRDDPIDSEQATRIIEECGIEYGACAIVFYGFVADDKLDAGVQEALTQALVLLCVPYVYLDMPMNQIGDSGWDFLVGDIGAVLRRK